MILAGQLTQAVRIEVATNSTNSYGESTISWGTYSQGRASIVGSRRDEISGGDLPRTVATHDVTLRYCPGLRGDMRIIWTSKSPERVLDIVSVTDLPQMEGHKLTCKEQTA